MENEARWTKRRESVSDREKPELYAWNLAVKEFRDSQGAWEAIWALCKEYPDKLQEALHRVIHEAFQRLSVRKGGISHKAIFKAIDWTKAKKGKEEARDALVWGEAIVEDEELCRLAIEYGLDLVLLPHPPPKRGPGRHIRSAEAVQ